MEPLIPQSRASAPAPSLIPAPSLAQTLQWLLPLEPRSPIFLGIRPIDGTGRDTRDALLEYTNSQQAAAFAFGTSPASTLSQEWRLIIVSDDTAHCYEITSGAILIPPQPQSWRALRHHDLAWRYPRIGYTVDSIEEITKRAIEISWPMKYSVYSENSQKFAYLLFEAIRQPHEPPTMSDILSGLDKIPRPFRTLFYRCVAVVIHVLLALRQRVRAAAKDTIRTLMIPAIAVQYGVWVKDILIACFVLVLFAIRAYLQLLVVLFLLAWGGNLRKASQRLRNIADDMVRFDEYQRAPKDSNKIV